MNVSIRAPIPSILLPPVEKKFNLSLGAASSLDEDLFKVSRFLIEWYHRPFLSTIFTVDDPRGRNDYRI